jgi:hypothetical protein
MPDASKWPNQVIPTRDTDVFVDQDMDVTLDVDGFARTIYVYGNLTFSEYSDLNLHADKIVIFGSGKLQASKRN